MSKNQSRVNIKPANIKLLTSPIPQRNGALLSVFQACDNMHGYLGHDKCPLHSTPEHESYDSHIGIDMLGTFGAHFSRSPVRCSHVRRMSLLLSSRILILPKVRFNLSDWHQNRN